MMTDTMEHFADSVRRSMKKRGITFVELSKRTGLHEASLHRILRNHRPFECRLVTADRIVKAFGDQDPQTNEWFFRNLNRILNERVISLYQLSRMTGLDRSGLYKMMSGSTVSPKVSTVETIAKALRISVLDLLWDPARLARKRAAG